MGNRTGKEFSRKTKSKAHARTKFVKTNSDEVYLCDGCQGELVPGQITYDHIKTIEEGGTNDLSNCQVLCKTCNGVKTYGEDIPRIRKGDRQRDGHSGASDRLTPLSVPRADRKARAERRSEDRRGPGKLAVPAPRNLFAPKSARSTP